MGALRGKNAEQLILLIFPSESFLRKIQEQVGAELHLCIYVLAYSDYSHVHRTALHTHYITIHYNTKKSIRRSKISTVSSQGMML